MTTFGIYARKSNEQKDVADDAKSADRDEDRRAPDAVDAIAHQRAARGTAERIGVGVALEGRDQQVARDAGRGELHGGERGVRSRIHGVRRQRAREGSAEEYERLVAPGTAHPVVAGRPDHPEVTHQPSTVCHRRASGC